MKKLIAAGEMEPATKQLTKACSDCALAILLVLAVIAVSGLTVQLLEKPKLQSQCPSLIDTWRAHGVPAHITIKCREQIE